MKPPVVVMNTWSVIAIGVSSYMNFSHSKSAVNLRKMYAISSHGAVLHSHLCKKKEQEHHYALSSHAFSPSLLPLLSFYPGCMKFSLNKFCYRGDFASFLRHVGSRAIFALIQVGSTHVLEQTI